MPEESSLPSPRAIIEARISRRRPLQYLNVLEGSIAQVADVKARSRSLLPIKNFLPGQLSVLGRAKASVQRQTFARNLFPSDPALANTDQSW